MDVHVITIAESHWYQMTDRINWAFQHLQLVGLFSWAAVLVPLMQEVSPALERFFFFLH